MKRLFLRRTSVRGIALFGLVVACCAPGVVAAEKRAQRSEQKARSAAAEAQALKEARALNREAAETDRAVAARFWNDESGSDALAHLVRAIHFDPSGKAAEQAISTLNAWGPPRFERTVTAKGRNWYTQVSRDGVHVLTCSDGPSDMYIVRIWETKSGKLIAEMNGHDGRFSPDGKQILIVDGAAAIYDIATKQNIVTLQEGVDGETSAEYSPDGMYVVTRSHRNKVRTWEVASGKLLATVDGGGTSIWSAEFSPDGKRILTASGRARVWDAATGKLLLTIGEEQPDGRKGAHYSPDGSRIMTYSGKEAYLWDATTGKQLAVLNDEEDDIRDAQFSPDGQRLVLMSRDLEMWEVATGKFLFQCDRPSRFSDRIGLSVEFSPDGSRFLSVMEKYPAKIWDAATGQFIAELWSETGEHDYDGVGSITAAHFSHDGTHVVTAAITDYTDVWNLPPPKNAEAPVLPVDAGLPPEWFSDFLLYMGRERLDAEGEYVEIPGGELSQLQQKLHAVLQAEVGRKSPYLSVLRYYLKN